MIKTIVLIYLLFGIIGTYFFVKMPETQEVLSGMPFVAAALCVCYSIISLPYQIIMGVITAITKRRNKDEN